MHKAAFYGENYPRLHLIGLLLTVISQ